MSSPTPARGVALASLGGLLWIAACTEPAPAPQPTGPAAFALKPFALAGSEPTDEQLAAVFDPDSLDFLDSRRVELLDTLDALAGSAEPVLVGLENDEITGEAFVDLAISLPAGGQAAYSVKLRRLAGGDWRVTWLSGPGLEWPAGRRRGESLSISSAPLP